MIIVGWTRYPPAATIATLTGYAHRLQYVGNSDSDYFDFLAAWWASGEREIVTVEHDIVPQPELIDEMLDCDRAWCAAMYPFEEHWLFGLGCTKFSLEIRQAMPDLFEQVAERTGGPHHPARHWCALDSHMQTLLNQKSGHTAHVHNRQEWIEHRNPEAPGAMKWRTHQACLLG